MSNKIFKTNVVNIESLEGYKYSIPTYQRPYVWGKEQIEKLLNDFYTSYKRFDDKDDKNAYYIGTILVRKKEDSFELIDGQQRFTTLWLIAFAISQKSPESILGKFLIAEQGALRLGFEIRSEVEDYLKKLYSEEIAEGTILEHEIIQNYPYLKHIAEGLASINGYIEQIDKDDLLPFGDFIYKNIYFITNTAPVQTDLNKLFSTINSAGVQLEQTDIVKSSLLNCLDDAKEKILCGKIWDSCENMNNFFERNARMAFPKTDWGKVDFSNLVEFKSSSFKFERDEDDEADKHFNIDRLEIDELEPYERHEEDADEKNRESEEIFCRSIINFGQLLLHTYRLHCYEHEMKDLQGTFHTNRLIEIFNEMINRNDKSEIVAFFRHLWKVRYLFDKYIVKWISDTSNKTESLEIANISRNKEYYYTRTKYEKSPSLMLQSVLYFTGDYLRQYWLTAYLGYLFYAHGDKPPIHKNHLKALETFDNIFSLNKSLTDKELSWQLLFDEDGEGIKKDIDIVKYLKETNGTGFKHYWFQKLEYILWKKNDFDTNDKKYKNFRIASKNSVEHIYPQHPENPNHHPPIPSDYLHSFGNLVLLNVSQNSEYSNKSYRVKKSMFEEKAETYDTMKSSYIFENSKWTEDEIIKHRDEMIELIEEYYGL